MLNLEQEEVAIELIFMFYKYFLLLGKLSHWIQLALSQEDTVHYTLVDRENCRRKVSCEGYAMYLTIIVIDGSFSSI